MKSKLLLNFVLIFFLISCGQFKETIEVQVGDTVRVSSTYFEEENKGLVYAWGPPKSNSGNIPEFQIKDNHLYFTPEEEDEYTINLSVETLGGEMIIEEEFNYSAIYKVNSSGSSNTESSSKSSKVLKQENRDEVLKTYYTVQFCAKTTKEEANVEFSKLEDMGYDEINMEEFSSKNTLYWRVRAGKFNSMKKAEKRRDEIASILKINAKDLWTLKVN